MFDALYLDNDIEYNTCKKNKLFLVNLGIIMNELQNRWDVMLIKNFS